jgi:hypothetical protein
VETKMETNWWSVLQGVRENENGPGATEMRTDESVTALDKSYEPTADEKAALQAIREHKKKALRVKAVKTQTRTELSLDHPDPLHGQAVLMRALATGEVDFFAELLALLGRASADGSQVNEQRLNFMLAVTRESSQRTNSRQCSQHRWQRFTS